MPLSTSAQESVDFDTITGLPRAGASGGTSHGRPASHGQVGTNNMTSTVESVNYDILDGGCGHNADADALTALGVEVKERFRDMRTAFLKMDQNHDGRISKKELLDLCKQWNVPTTEAQRVLRAADLDHNGTLDFNEFAQRFDPYEGPTDSGPLSATVSSSADRPIKSSGWGGGGGADDRPIKSSGWDMEGGGGGWSDMPPEQASAAGAGTHAARALQGARTASKDSAKLAAKNEELERDLAACHRKTGALEKELADSAKLAARNEELERDLAACHKKNGALEKELEKELAAAKDRIAASKDGAKLAAKNEELERDLAACHKKNGALEKELAAAKDRIAELERQLASRPSASDGNGHLKDRIAELERQLASRPPANDGNGLHHHKAVSSAGPPPKDDPSSVFVYGKPDCPKTAAMQKALHKAGVPFEFRDMSSDKRYLEALKASGGPPSAKAPVVVRGTKAWWNEESPDNEMFAFSFEEAVAAELRHMMGIGTANPVVVAPVRMDADIETEIAERFVSMQQAFLKLDINQDGRISKKELIAKCKDWNIPTSEAERAIAEADWDHNGTLDFNEFAKRFDNARGQGFSKVHHK